MTVICNLVVRIAYCIKNKTQYSIHITQYERIERLTKNGHTKTFRSI